MHVALVQAIVFNKTEMEVYGYSKCALSILHAVLKTFVRFKFLIFTLPYIMLR